MYDRSLSVTTVVLAILLVWLWVPAAAADDGTIADVATASAPSSTWIAIQAPFTGDENGNGYTVYELGSSENGPFEVKDRLAGPPEWRAMTIRGLSPGTSYFVRVTFVDPDGVTGDNPQLLGPITTLADAPNAVGVGPALALASDTEIYVSVPIEDDANANSFGTVEIATSPGGPWMRKCGSTFDPNLPFHPKRCRVRGLTPGTDYWIRVTLLDGDGVTGTNPQIVGPVRYEGARNLALGRPISADPGWGCCPNPSELVDGRIQNDAWYFGFAWTGGTSCWAGGCPPGFKQATVDLGAPTTFNRAVVWYHSPSSVPVDWKFQYSHDGVAWQDAHSNTEPRCRAANVELPGAWYHPGCGHDATFPAVTARFFRYTFDDRTLFRGLHGWAVEIEVFHVPANQPPVADAGADHTVSASDECAAEVTLDGSASSDPDGDELTYTWVGPFGEATGVSPTVSLPFGPHIITLTVDDGNGSTDSDTVAITVEDTTAPSIQAATPSPAMLWPPNHRMVPVTIGVPALDNCDAAPACRVVAVSSNEPVDGLGDGDAAPDWVISGALTTSLRAERAGRGSGRLYTIEVACTDFSGNRSSAPVLVTVPRDRRR